MQTISILEERTKYGCNFSVENGNFLVAIGNDITDNTKYAGGNHKFGMCSNCTFNQAYNFITMSITDFFMELGIDVHFISKD